MKLLSRKTFYKYICQLRSNWEIGTSDKATIQFLFNKVSIYLYVFGPIMLNCIV